MELLSAEGIVTAMYDIGLQLFVGDDGAVHGKMRGGGKMPLEAWALVDQLHLSNDAVAAYLRAHPIMTLVGITVDECCAYCECAKNGDLRLIGNVVYHESTTGLCDISFQVVSNDG